MRYNKEVGEQKQAIEVVVAQVLAALAGCDEEELTLTLDDLVMDGKDEEAANMNNGASDEEIEAYAGEAARDGGTALEDMEDVDAFGLVHDLKGEEASDINNGGMEVQVRYLLEAWYGANESGAEVLVARVKAEMGISL